MGADDYTTKPFSPRELAARVRATLRRPRTPNPAMTPTDTGYQTPPSRNFGSPANGIASRQVFLDRDPIPLTRNEFATGVTGGSPSIAARSVPRKSTGRPSRILTLRLLAIGSHCSS